jgi:hypothetical protein
VSGDIPESTSPTGIDGFPFDGLSLADHMTESGIVAPSTPIRKPSKRKLTDSAGRGVYTESTKKKIFTSPMGTEYVGTVYESPMTRLSQSINDDIQSPNIPSIRDDMEKLDQENKERAGLALASRAIKDIHPDKPGSQGEFNQGVYDAATGKKGKKKQRRAQLLQIGMQSLQGEERNKTRAVDVDHVTHAAISTNPVTGKISSVSGGHFLDSYTPAQLSNKGLLLPNGTFTTSIGSIPKTISTRLNSEQFLLLFAQSVRLNQTPDLERNWYISRAPDGSYFASYDNPSSSVAQNSVFPLAVLRDDVKNTKGNIIIGKTGSFDATKTFSGKDFIASAKDFYDSFDPSRRVYESADRKLQLYKLDAATRSKIQKACGSIPLPDILVEKKTP